jgi:hypothetical protein
MKVIVQLISLLVLIQSCDSQQSNSTNNKSTLIKDSDFIKFGLPYKSLSTDQNELIFYSMNQFDTSILIHFKKQMNEVRGVYYEVLPIYHRNVEDYLGGTNELIFFDGFTFKMDTIKWNQLKEQVNNYLLIQDSSSRNEVCADCTHYILAHHNKVGLASNLNRSYFSAFELYLKDSVINQLINLKKPQLHR